MCSACIATVAMMVCRRELNERRSRRRRGEVTFEDRRKEYRFANPILTYEVQR